MGCVFSPTLTLSHLQCVEVKSSASQAELAVASRCEEKAVEDAIPCAALTSAPVRCFDIAA